MGNIIYQKRLDDKKSLDFSKDDIANLILKYHYAPLVRQFKIPKNTLQIVDFDDDGPITIITENNELKNIKTGEIFIGDYDHHIIKINRITYFIEQSDTYVKIFNQTFSKTLSLTNISYVLYSKNKVFLFERDTENMIPQIYILDENFDIIKINKVNIPFTHRIVVSEHGELYISNHTERELNNFVLYNNAIYNQNISIPFNFTGHASHIGHNFFIMDDESVCYGVW